MNFRDQSTLIATVMIRRPIAKTIDFDEKWSYLIMGL